MKCKVTFYFANDFFYKPSEVNIVSMFIKGDSLEDCQHKAFMRVIDNPLMIQEVRVQGVK